MKKNKKGIDNLLDKLSDKNIKNIAKKLKKCSFCFCQENLQQLKLMETNEKIISITLFFLFIFLIIFIFNQNIYF